MKNLLFFLILISTFNASAVQGQWPPGQNKPMARAYQLEFKTCTQSSIGICARQIRDIHGGFTHHQNKDYGYMVIFTSPNLGKQVIDQMMKQNVQTKKANVMGTVTSGHTTGHSNIILHVIFIDRIDQIF